MKVLHTKVVANRLSWRVISTFAACLFASEMLFGHSAFSQSQTNGVPALLVTPSTITLLAGDTATLSAVDETGRPVANVQWSIQPQIAYLYEQNGEVSVQGIRAGRATLTATANELSATAAVSVVDGDKLAPATVRWSLQPMPGFQTLLVSPTVRVEGGPAFYSLEWSKSENAIVRALRESGQQIWMTHLASRGSPATLQHTLPDFGQIFQNDVMVRDQSTFIIGAKGNFFVGSNSIDPSSLGLPADGKSILLGTVVDNAGGIILLERGRFRDSLVDLNPADGSELWRYRSEGRLTNEWTVNGNDVVGIVETIAKPVSSALLMLNATTGQIQFRTPFPLSSSTIDGFRCTEAQRNILKSLRPSRSGSVFTSENGNIYVQVETHIESEVAGKNCKDKQFSFDNTLALLSVTPEGEADWKTFQHIHASGQGDMVPQPRVLAGETIPDGFGGVLAAWTWLSPNNVGGQIHSEARLSRIGPSGQRDFTLPMPYWTKGLNSFFAANMILGEGNVLYAINGQQLLRFDTEAGEVKWMRHPPTGEIKLEYSTQGGGLIVSNAGRLVYFDAQGDGVPIAWTVQVSNLEDIGLIPAKLFEDTPVEPLQLREVRCCWNESGNMIGVEDGGPYGRGTLVYFTVK
jgi:outer membrane protein assembly factor BamB